MPYGACCKLQDSLLLRQAQVHTPGLIFSYLALFNLLRLLEGGAIIIQEEETNSKKVTKVISVRAQILIVVL